MSDKDNYNYDSKNSPKGESATRARNRTVMLTPDITGQVRAKLSQGGTQVAAPFSNHDADVAETISPQNVAPGKGFYSQMVQPVAEENMATTVPQSVVIDYGERVHTSPAKPVQVQAETASKQANISVNSQISQINDLGIWSNKSPLVGFLVSYDNNELGDVCSLRTGRMIVTSTPQATGNYILINDESVSSLHAIIRISASGEIQILDQLSESGTFIKRFGTDEQIELSGEKSFLEHGDVVRFGKRTFHVSLIVRNEQ
jgi:FHA domain